jgi:hypothetical protein
LETEALAASRWYELESADLSELPGAVVVPAGIVRKTSDREKFYAMKPNKDAPRARHTPEEKLTAAAAAVDPRERWYLMPSVLDGDGAPQGEEGDDFDEADPEDAVRGRRRRAGGAPRVGEDPGRWYTMRPRLIPDSAPHVLATLPEERLELGWDCCASEADAPPPPPGGPTPWPEKSGKWFTMDNKARFRQQQVWEVPPEQGQYNEWLQAAADDVVAPRFYDQPERWIHMAPIDDQTTFKHAADDPKAAVNYTNARPPEDRSRWYKIPSAYHELPAEQPAGGPWREC